MELMSDHAYRRSLHKSPVIVGSESFQAGTQIHIQEGDAPATPQGPKPLSSRAPQTSLSVSLHLAVHLYLLSYLSINW